MISISTSDLRHFMSKAANIKGGNNAIPIYDCILIECKKKIASLTKSNAISFVTEEMEGIAKKDISFLIPENVLLAALQATNASEIRIELHEKPGSKEGDTPIPMLHIYDDDIVNMKIQTHDVKLFPRIVIPEKPKKTILTKEMIDSIKIAASFTAGMKDLGIWMNYIQFKKIPSKKNSSCIFASDGHTMYYKQFKADFPDIILDPTYAKIISGYENIEYFSHENYDYFWTGKAMFGFVKPETIAQDFLAVVAMLNTEKNFSFASQPVVKWSQMAKMIDKTSLINVVVIQEGGKSEFVLKYNDTGRDSDAKYSVKTVSKNFKLPDFACNVDHLIKMLGNIPYETVQFNGPVSHSYFVTTPEDPDFIGCVREVVYNK